MPVRARKCCIPSCKSFSTSDTVDPILFHTISKKWPRTWINCFTDMSVRENALKRFPHQHPRLYVCHLHFESKFHAINKNGLTPYAHPTLFTPEEVRTGVPDVPFYVLPNDHNYTLKYDRNDHNYSRLGMEDIYYIETNKKNTEVKSNKPVKVVDNNSEDKTTHFSHLPTDLDDNTTFSHLPTGHDDKDTILSKPLTEPNGTTTNNFKRLKRAYSKAHTRSKRPTIKKSKPTTDPFLPTISPDDEAISLDDKAASPDDKATSPDGIATNPFSGLTNSYNEAADEDDLIQYDTFDDVAHTLLDDDLTEPTDVANESPEGITFSWQNPNSSVPCDVDQEVSESIKIPDDPLEVSLYDDTEPTRARVSITTEIAQDDECSSHDYRCNLCDGSISGFRYTCVQCADFDICAQCEAGAAHAHHYMLRVPGARPYAEIQEVMTTIRRILLSDSVIQMAATDQPIKEELKEEEADPMDVEQVLEGVPCGVGGGGWEPDDEPLSTWTLGEDPTDSEHETESQRGIDFDDQGNAMLSPSTKYDIPAIEIDANTENPTYVGLEITPSTDLSVRSITNNDQADAHGSLTYPYVVTTEKFYAFEIEHQKITPRVFNKIAMNTKNIPDVLQRKQANVERNMKKIHDNSEPSTSLQHSQVFYVQLNKDEQNRTNVNSVAQTKMSSVSAVTNQSRLRKILPRLTEVYVNLPRLKEEEIRAALAKR